MFNKLLANLPFNPSLTAQIAFYGKRLHKETSIRRLGLLFVVLALAIQFFAVISPPQSSLAASTNDIIFGGIRGGDPKTRLLAVYDANSDGHNGGIQALFQSFNISRDDLVRSTPSTVNSGDHTLYSLGRNPHSVLDQSWIAGGLHYYLRPLYTWGDHLTYQVLSGVRSSVNGTSDDRYFAVMYDCGNIIVKVRSLPHLTPPTKVARTDSGLPAANTTVTPGQLIGYRVFFSNLGAGIAHNVEIVDHIPNNTAYSSHGSGAATNGGQLIGNQVLWQWTQMGAQQQNWYVDLTVKVASNVSDGTQICNVAYLSSLESPTQQVSQQVCHVVHIPKTPPPIIPPPQVTPGQPHIIQSKLASNLTQQVADAQKTNAQAGDIISYQLLTMNSGSATAPAFVVTDQINDILEYATVTDISDSGKLANGTITWPAADIKSNATLTRTFQIQVKNPVPTTPRSSSDPQSFDLRMDDVYGNLVSISISPPTVAKVVEQVTTTLPNTGPGTSLVVAFAFTLITGYFFARSRLLAKETDIIRSDYAQKGGGL